MPTLPTPAVPLEHKRFNIGGLHIAVYNLPAVVSSSNKSVGVLIATHGRGENQWALDVMVRGVIDKAKELDTTDREKGGKRSRRELVVVTLDQRNHGERLVNALANEAFHKNPTHAVDMYSVFQGTRRDISFLIDFLPSYLFPLGEKTIEEYFVTGVSLGGHATWSMLRHDPRVKVGIPIIGCPDYKALLEPRVQKRPPVGGPSSLIPPVWPDSLDLLIKRDDPISCAYQSSNANENPYIGKKILILGGGADRLVPPKFGFKFFDGLNVGPEGKKEMIIQDGIGHEVSPEMIERLGEWIWEHGLTVSSRASGSDLELKSEMKSSL